MYCISVSYRNANSDERQFFSFSKSDQVEFLTRLKNDKMISGGVIVSTCNRSEIYVNLENEMLEDIEKSLAEFKNLDMDFIRTVCFYYEGKKAIRHLMKVTAGLDSMILGEDEILHQMKEAYLNAFNEGLTDGDINMIFQSSFNSAKAIKTDTDLSKTAVSYGTLSANEIQNFLENDFGIEGGFVLVLGATGKMGSILVKNLLDKGIPVVGTSRTHGGFSYEIKVEHRDKVKIVPFADRYKYVKNAAAIVSCTASPHYVLSRKKYQEAMCDDNIDSRRKLLIDLAIPYDIDREIARCAGVTLLDIDYFKYKAKANEAHKLSEKERAELILNECLEDLMKKIYIRKYLPRIIENRGKEWNEKTLYDIKDSMDSDTLLNVLIGLAN